MNFNPRSPCGERPWLAKHLGMDKDISIHAPRVGSDVIGKRERLPVRVISIHAPRVGSDDDAGSARLPGRISIHAPRVGSDRLPQASAPGGADFNPRSPCGERPPSCPGAPLGITFQSTLPVWGATFREGVEIHGFLYFNPRSPCGERHLAPHHTSPLGKISIHAPRVGSDGRDSSTIAAHGRFQSTLPVWGATTTGGRRPHVEM